MTDPVDTPTAILASAATMLREHTFDDLSYRALGDAVGVSERTVYRHYPTRSHLLAALAGWVERNHFALSPFVTIDDFRSAVRARFRAFDAAPAYAFVCARAATLSLAGDSEPSHLTRAVEGMIAAHASTLNDRDRRRIAATLVHFASAPFWARSRTGFDMDADEISDVVDAACRRVVGGDRGFGARRLAESSAPGAS